jgi:hypothetical protein
LAWAALGTLHRLHELRRHSRAAPICLDENLQPGSAKGHYLLVKALLRMDEKTWPAIGAGKCYNLNGKQERKPNMCKPNCCGYLRSGVLWVCPWGHEEQLF